MNKNLILGAVLADGTSRRMQKSDSAKTDKCFSLLAGRPLIEHVISRANDQVDSLVINSSSTEPLLASYNLPIIPDFFLENPTAQKKVSDNHLGPLGGIASVLRWAQAENTSHGYNYQWLATFPCDTPFFPLTLVSRLLDAAQKNNAVAACAINQENVNPLCSIWSLDVLPDLISFLEEGNRKVMQFLDLLDHVKVNFEPQPLKNIEPFYNINTPEQLEKAQRMNSQLKG